MRPQKTVPRIRLCTQQAMASCPIRKVSTSGLDLAIYRVGKDFFVTSDACTHGPGSLSEGMLDGEEIECNFHQGRFNVRTGEAVGPPCVIPIHTYKVVLDKGFVCIDV
jgi:nitrite reductase/ring-hydroxylating ferredoxin subunit